MPAALPDTATVLGAHIPRRGNALSRGFWRLLLRLLGWRLVGSPPDAPRMVVTAAPHTSNVDGLLLLAGAFALGFDQHWIVKHTMFKGWRSPLLRWSGAIGVDRGRAGGMVQQVLELFATRRQFVLVIAPEGTRRRVDAWKSGFYRIAQRAGVPVCLGFIDYDKRLVGFGPSFVPSGDFRADLARMSDFYGQVTPRHPHRFALPAKLAE